MSTRSAITTHVLDTALGRPAAGVGVRLESLQSGTTVAVGTTDDDGRVSSLGPEQVEPGTYRLVFDVAGYCAASGQACFFPEVSITFVLPDSGGGSVDHHHVPLLLSPFAYSTYRGS